ncbi:PAS domain-containing protein [Halobaculum litoreum]|uniref:PAS domain-containing protein n=1 Tax=Halobaculum litoreum TaxID=3031998 RepID=A0ABD5XZP9_9EURY|nr:PAS domain-containing protein [Halobaculum sp. DT92]
MDTSSLSTPLAETLAAFDGSGTPLATPEVAAGLSVGRRGTYERLRTLADRGLIRTKKVGANARIWWRPGPPTGTVGSDTRGPVDGSARGPAPAAAASSTELTAALGAAARAGSAIAAIVDASGAESRIRRLERRCESLRAELSTTAARLGAEFVAVDAASRITWHSPDAATLLGVARADAVGWPVSEALPAGDDEDADDVVRQVMESGESVRVERPVPAAEIRIEISAFPSATGVSVYLRDVTDRVRRARALARHEAAVTATADGAFAVDADGRVTWADETFASLVDETPAALVGTALPAVVDDDRLLEVVQSVTGSDGDADPSTPVETTVTGPDDAQRIWELRAAPVDSSTTGDGERAVVVRDVTEQRDRERSLAESGARLRTLVDAIPNGTVTLVSPDLRYRTVGGTTSDAVASADELEGRRLRDVLPEAVADGVIPGYESALAGEPATSEQVFGGRTYECHHRPVRDDEGRVVSAFGIAYDVTERTRTERTLRRQAVSAGGRRRTRPTRAGRR